MGCCVSLAHEVGTTTSAANKHDFRHGPLARHDGQPCLPLATSPNKTSGVCEVPVALVGLAPHENQKAQVLHPNICASCHELDLLLSALRLICNAPHASISLHHGSFCWLTNTQGCRAGALPMEALSDFRQTIVCGDVLESGHPEEHTLTWREHGLRSYCCAPLLTPKGLWLGTVCFVDVVPRRIDAGMCRVLNNFGELAVRVLERQIELLTNMHSLRLPVPGVLQRLYTFVHDKHDKHDSATDRDNNAAQPQKGIGLLHTLNTGHSWPCSMHHREHHSLATCSCGKHASNAISNAVHSPVDVLLESSADRRKRHGNGMHDACCVVVDAGAPGWPVLYVDETWKMWSGFSRSAVFGHGLQALLMPAPPCVAPINWDMIQHEADAGERFIIPGVVAALKQQPADVMPPTHTHPPGTSQNTSEPSTHTGHYYRLDTNFNTSYPGTSKRSSGSGGGILDVGKDPGPGCRHKPQAAAKDVFAQLQTSSVSVHSMSAVGGLYGHLDTAWTSHTEDLLQHAALARAMHEAGGSTGSRGRGTRFILDSSKESYGYGRGSGVTLAAGDGCSGTSFAARSGGSAVVRQQGRVFDLIFRPLALDMLDEDTLPMGIPPSVPMEACAPMRRLYAAWLHVAASADMPTQPLAPALKVSHQPSAMQHAAHCSTLFPGLAMAQVLGKGGYGTAHLGRWHSVDVVVKVQDYQLSDTGALRTAQIEVALGQLLRHPHLVRTIAHGAVELEDMPVDALHQRQHTQGGPGITGDDMNWRVSLGGFSSFTKYAMDESMDGSFSHRLEHVKLRSSLLGNNVVQELLPPPESFVNAACVAPDASTAAIPAAEALASQVRAGHDAPLGLTVTNPNPTTGAVNIASKDGARTHNATAFAACISGLATQSSDLQNVDASALTLFVQGQQDSMMAHPYVASDFLVEPCSAPIVYQPLTAPDRNPQPPIALPPAPRTHRDTSQPASAATIASGCITTGLTSNHVLRSDGIAAQNSFVAAAAAAGAHKTPVPSSISSDMALMMASTEIYDMMMGAKPMAFPMQLRTFAVLEYCDGGTLQEAITTGWFKHSDGHPHAGALHLLRLLTLARHVACAVAYLHMRGVVHADLTAANVLLCSARPNVPTTSAAKLCVASPATSKTLGNGPRSNSSCRMGVPSPICTYAQQEQDCSSLQQQGPGKQIMNGVANANTRPSSMREAEQVALNQPSKRYWLLPPTELAGHEYIAKVADFGKSCLLDDKGMTQATGGYATMSYAAPEVLRERILSPAADVYAMGVLLWQMYTGSQPWVGLTSPMILATILNASAELVWPDHVAESLPPAEREVGDRLVALGRACLSHEPSSRPDMVVVEAELLQLLSTLQPTHST